jgi:hypothetical protein
MNLKKIIFKKLACFFSARKPPFSAPRLPRNPPQTHHKNTTAAHHIFPKPPLKHQQTRGFHTATHAQIFSEN